ncbi:unnamed protein product [Enterobius vermicularis]|uniref:ANK_REP_REGION domain-containing protein n=1 Tax=Enterobius vermicularis TaxID=51028 RepID=A0A0N4VJF6_ENTVE|nr:unnamed protein product [Enterobius vermicularis]
MPASPPHIVSRKRSIFKFKWFKRFSNESKLDTSRSLLLLVKALANDEVACLKALIKSDIRLLSETLGNRNLLHVAAENGSSKSLSYLLKVFCEQEKKKIRRGLLDSVENVYGYLVRADDSGDTPLHLACRDPSAYCFKVIFRSIVKHLGWTVAGKVLLQCNHERQNPLHVACLWKNVEVVRLLLTNEFERKFAGIYILRFPTDGSLQKIRNLRMALTSTLKDELKKCPKPEYADRPVSNSDLFSLPQNFSDTENDISVPEETCLSCERCNKFRSSVQKIFELVTQKVPAVLSQRREGGVYPLMAAVRNDAIVVVKLLLSLKVDLEAEDWEGRTALHYAAEHGVARQVALLLSHGAVPLHKDYRGVTPLHLAALRGQTTSLRLLYLATNLKDIPTSDSFTAFLWSACRGIEASLRTMLQMNPNLDKSQHTRDNSTAMHLSASHGHSECRRTKGAETPLLLAAKYGHIETLRILVEFGADTHTIDAKGNCCLHLASKAKLSRELFQHFLVLIPFTEMINMKNAMGKTPLHCAVEAQRISSACELVELGANIRARDNTGWDPFMYAIRSGSSQLIALMLEHSPNVNCCSVVNGYSTLSLALKHGDAMLVNHLKSRGAKLPKELMNDAARK